VHLSAIKLRGFKSFPDPVKVRLERGVAVVVGPNGSGKSNVSDALLWASGSLSPSELRAEKPDDVLFAGSAGRPAADWCEVELLFDNADGQFSELEFSDIAITRRLHRGGEGQYLVNKAAVRRTDLVELLADVGLGGGHSSVIGQGRVEEILSSKPEQRRALLEEAAGLGKFKARRHRGAAHGRHPRSESREREAGGAAHRAQPGRGGSRGCRRPTGGGDSGAVPTAERRRSSGAAPRGSRGACRAPAGRAAAATNCRRRTASNDARAVVRGRAGAR